MMRTIGMQRLGTETVNHTQRLPLSHRVGSSGRRVNAVGSPAIRHLAPALAPPSTENIVDRSSEPTPAVATRRCRGLT